MSRDDCRLGRWIARRGPALAGALAALLVLLTPLAVGAWRANPEPELRVLATGSNLSGLIVDGDARILLINTDDRTTARAALGHLTRPWEPAITTLVAPATAEAAPGMLEALQRTRPSGVVVLGTPAPDPVWEEIERVCAARAIALSYVADESRSATARLTLRFFASASPDSGAALVLQRDEVSVVFAFDAGPVAARGQVLVSNDEPAMPDAATVRLTSGAQAGDTRQVVVGGTTPTRLSLEPNRLRLNGGRLLEPRAASPAPTREATP